MSVNAVFSLLAFAAVFFFGEELMRAFTHDPKVIAIGKEYLLIVGGFFIIHGTLNVYNGASEAPATPCSLWLPV
jgi:MatE.